MAQRIVTPVSFSSITYDTTNENKRWFIEGLDTTVSTDFTVAANRATYITNLFGSIGAGGAAGNALDVGVTPKEVTIAVRIPQTKRLMDLIIKRTSGTSADFDSKGISYDIYVSGRSDKMYSEIIDWVKVTDSTEQHPDTDAVGFVPVSTRTTPLGSSDAFHARFFPFMSSWVKIVFHSVTDTTDLALDRILFHEFVEDNQVTGAVTNPATEEEAPIIEVVFPRNGAAWLPSQTVMFTTRIQSPDYDCCHFGFEIYKESDATPSSGSYTGPSSPTGPLGVYGLNANTQDILVARYESNKLNLDGTVNQWHTADWVNLPDTRANVTNSVYFPGIVKNGSGTSPRAVLVVPIEGGIKTATRSTQALFNNIKFYKNSGNVLKWDAKNGVGANAGVPTLFSANNITLPAYDTAAGKFSEENIVNATGWVIEFPSNIDFDRIDFINDVDTKVASRVKLYFMPGDPGTNTPTVNLVDGAWNEVGAWSPDPRVAKIEFCYPKTNVYTQGYLEGTEGQLTADPDSYNPDRIGKGIGQSNDGDWTIVPSFSGLMLGDESVNGDSPVEAGETFATTVAIGTNNGNFVYCKVPLQDPYRDGDRFYVRGYVWDGRTEQA